MLSATDFVLKRFLKFVLKRKLGKYLHELDLAALDMDIGTAGVALDVRNILLKCDQITADLALDGWDVRACYLGHVKAQLPFSALGMLGGSCCLQCDELLLTIAACPSTGRSAQKAPRKAASNGPGLSNATSNMQQENGLLGEAPVAALEELGLVGPTSSSMDELIQRIAGGLHAMLHKLSVSVTNVLIRVELPLDATDQQASSHSSSAPVAIISINLDSVQLMDQSHQSGTGFPSQSKQPGSNGCLGGSGAKMANGAMPTGTKQVHKQVEVKGLSIQMQVGPAVHASADAMEQATARHGQATSHAHSSAAHTANSGNTADQAQSCVSIPLLSDPAGDGVSLTLGVCVTSSNSSTAGAATNRHMPDRAMPAKHPAASSIAVHVQLGPCLLRVLPQHHACISAAAQLLSHMQQQHGDTAVAAAAPSMGPDTVPCMMTLPSDVMLQPQLIQGVCGVADGQWGMPQQRETWQQAAGPSTEHDNPARWSAANGGVWGTSSLLSSFLLDDYHDLVATSLQPLVAQSLSLADSRMADDNGWGTGPLSYSALYSADEHMDAMPPRHARSFCGWDAGHGMPGSSYPHESVLTDTGSDAFQDARSVFSSYPNSAANSVHSAKAVHAQGPSARPAWYDASQAAYHTQHMQAAGRFGNSTAPLPPPPPTPTPQPEYHLTVHCDELQLFLGFDGAEKQHASMPAGLLVTTSELAASCHVLAVNISGSLELQQLHIMELVPVYRTSNHGDAALGQDAAWQQAWEFAAMPSKLHQSLNCFRPDPAWLVAPAWALAQPNAVTPAKLRPSTHQPGSSRPGGGGNAAQCVTWPVLYCGGGLRSSGVRPSVCIRIHKPTVKTDSAYPVPYIGSSSGLTGNGLPLGNVPQMASWGAPGVPMTSISAANTEPLLRSRSSLSEVSMYPGSRQPASSALQVQVELLPITVWACPAGIERMQQGCQPLIDAFSHSSARTTLTPIGLRSSDGHGMQAPALSAIPSSSRGADPVFKQYGTMGMPIAKAATAPGSLPELELSLSIPHVCVLARFPLQLPQAASDDNHPAASASAKASSQQAQKAGGMSGLHAPQSLYMLLDMLCPSHQDHVSHQRMLPHQGPPFIRLVCDRQQGELLIRTSASCDIAAARMRLHVIHAAPDPPPVAFSTSHTLPHTLPPHVPPHRHARPTSQHHATSTHATKQPTAPALTPSHTISPTRWVVLSLLEVQPRYATQPVASSGHQPAGGLGVHSGSQDLPPGCGVFATIQWDPQGPSNTARRSLSGDASSHDQLVQASVQHYVDAHASSRWCDEEEGEGEGEGPGWGGRASPGPGSIRAVQLVDSCRESAQVFIHMRLSSAHLQVSDTDVATLTALQLAAAPSRPAATSTVRRQAELVGASRKLLQITSIIQASVLVTLKSGQQRESGSTAPAAFSLRLGEVSVLHVANVAGSTGAMLVSVSAQDVQLTRQGWRQDDWQVSKSSSGRSKASGARADTQQHARGAGKHGHSQAAHAGSGSDRVEWWLPPTDEDLCVLYCPTRPNSSSPQPCIDVLFHKPAASSSCPASAHARSGNKQVCTSAPAGTAPESPCAPILSVLVRGITIATDHGSLNLSWAQELAQLLTPPSSRETSCPSTHDSAPQCGDGAGHSNNSQGSGQAQPELAAQPLQLVVTLQDIALRHEPVGYPSQQVATDYIRTRCPEQAAALAHAASGGDVPTSTDKPSQGNATASTSSPAARKQGTGAAAPALSPVAMVLLAEHVRYELNASNSTHTASTLHPSPGTPASAQRGSACNTPKSHTHQQHLVVINSVGLHLALAHDRGPGWGPGDSVDVAGCKLQSYGYHCVLSETALHVTIKVPRTPSPTSNSASSDDAKPPMHAAWASNEVGPAVDIEIHNQQVLGVLTQDSAALLLQLSAQLGTYIAAASAIPITSTSQRMHSNSNGQNSMQASASQAADGPRTVGMPQGAALQGAGYESVRARTEEIMRELLSQEHYFKSSAVMAAVGAGAQAGHQAASTSGWYDHASDGSTVGGGAANAVTTPLTEKGKSSSPGPHVIDDFFAVAQRTSLDGQSNGLDGLSSGWEHMPSSNSVVPIHHANRTLRNSPPEAGGMWFPAQPCGTSTAEGHPHSLGNGSSYVSKGRGAGSISVCGSYTSALCISPSASGTASSFDRLSDITLGGYVPAMGLATTSNTANILPATPNARSATVQPTANQSQGLPLQEQQQGSGRPNLTAPGLRLCEDYIPVGSPSSLLSPGSMHLGVNAARRPCPTVRITFSNFAGLSVLHTTRGSGGVQAGRVEAEVEGATLVIEMYPQGVHEAKLIHLSVCELEIRDCRALQHMQPQHSSSTAGHDLSPAALWGVPYSHHSGSSSGGSSAGSSRHRRYAAAARVGSGLANGVGVAAQLTLGKAAELAVPGRSNPKKWVKILSYRQRADQPRDSRAAQLEVVLESVRPDPLHQPALEELRMKVRLLPVRLRLDQDVLQYLIAFGTAVFNPHTAAALELLGQLQLAAQSGGESPALPFFQYVHLAPCAFTIDYRPRRIDVAALKAGSLVELLAMVPIGGLELDTIQVLLSGVAGWDQLGSAVAREWITHIAQTQAHKFLLGLAPVHALARVASAVSSILGAPPLARHVSRGMARAASAATDTLVGLRRLQEGRMATQVREGVVALARLLVAEALAASAHLSAAGVSPSGAARVLTMQPLPHAEPKAAAAPAAASLAVQQSSVLASKDAAEEEHLVLELEEHESLWNEADLQEDDQDKEQQVGEISSTAQATSAGVDVQVCDLPTSGAGPAGTSGVPSSIGHVSMGMVQPLGTSHSQTEAGVLRERTCPASSSTGSSLLAGIANQATSVQEQAAVAKHEQPAMLKQQHVLTLTPPGVSPALSSMGGHRPVQPLIEYPIHVAQSPSCSSTAPSSGGPDNSTHTASWPVCNSSLHMEASQNQGGAALPGRAPTAAVLSDEQPLGSTSTATSGMQHKPSDGGTAKVNDGESIAPVNLGLHHRSAGGHNSSRLATSSSLVSRLCIEDEVVIVSPVAGIHTQPSINWAEYENVKAPPTVIDADQLKSKVD